MSLLTLYLISTLPSLAVFFSLMGTFGLVLGIIFSAVGHCDNIEFARCIGKKLIPAGVAFLFLGTLTPNKEQLYFIVGGYAATNDTELKKLPDNILKAANSWLENVAVKATEKKDAKPTH